MSVSRFSLGPNIHALYLAHLSLLSSFPPQILMFYSRKSAIPRRTKKALFAGTQPRQFPAGLRHCCFCCSFGDRPEWSGRQWLSVWRRAVFFRVGSAAFFVMFGMEKRYCTVAAQPARLFSVHDCCGFFARTTRIECLDGGRWRTLVRLGLVEVELGILTHSARLNGWLLPFSCLFRQWVRMVICSI